MLDLLSLRTQRTFLNASPWDLFQAGGFIKQFCEKNRWCYDLMVFCSDNKSINPNVKLYIQEIMVGTRFSSTSYAILGLVTRPMKRTVPDRLSLITKRKGWLATKTDCGAKHDTMISTPAPAAASAPSSFTSIYALCITCKQKHHIDCSVYKICW